MKQNKKIMIIGSTQYQNKITEHQKKLESEGYEVLIPAFDSRIDFNELDVCKYNLSLVEKADEVHVIWDQRSTGTIFDFGMCFALRKIYKVIYLEPKTFAGAMKLYEEEMKC